MRPYPGQNWAEQGQARHQSHEYVRNGTARLLTLFCPRTGKLRAKGVTAVLAHLPQPPPGRGSPCQPCGMGSLAARPEKAHHPD
jgi:hypothetical protein